jgi:16S rRNA (uracil1498-N3)-methyltransferase
MHTFLGSKKEGEYITLEERELKHFRARRIHKGESFRVIYGRELYLCQLHTLDKHRVVCRVLEPLPTPPPSCSIRLFQCVPFELKTFDTIVRFATEVGVSSIVPVISSRSFRKPQVIHSRTERWKRLIQEGMKLSGNPSPPRIEEPVPLEDVNPTQEINLLLDNFHKGKSILEIERCADSYSLVVGPEGGFSEEEVKLLLSRGFEPVYLKPGVMRTETAMLVACGVLVNMSCP